MKVRMCCSQQSHQLRRAKAPIVRSEIAPSDSMCGLVGQHFPEHGSDERPTRRLETREKVTKGHVTGLDLAWVAARCAMTALASR